MAAKKKQSKIDPTGLSPKSRTQPTASFTSPGKKPTQSRSRSAAEKPKETKVTKVKNAESGFAGSGTPLGTSFGISRPTAAKNVANALFTVAMTPASGQIRNFVAKKIGGKVGQIAGESAFGPASKGLPGATGMGGRISKTWTPAGQAYRSTIVGTPAQQSARIGNLYANAERIANTTARQARNRTIIGIVKGSQKAGKIGREATAIGVVAANKKKNKKK